MMPRRCSNCWDFRAARALRFSLAALRKCTRCACGYPCATACATANVRDIGVETGRDTLGLPPSGHVLGGMGSAQRGRARARAHNEHPTPAVLEEGLG
eukprot:9502607-Pyramimonas_sp.AAC.1